MPGRRCPVVGRSQRTSCPLLSRMLTSLRLATVAPSPPSRRRLRLPFVVQSTILRDDLRLSAYAGSRGMSGPSPPAHAAAPTRQSAPLHAPPQACVAWMRRAAPASGGSPRQGRQDAEPCREVSLRHPRQPAEAGPAADFGWALARRGPGVPCAATSLRRMDATRSTSERRLAKARSAGCRALP